MTTGVTMKGCVRARRRKREQTWRSILLSAAFGFSALIIVTVLLKTREPTYGGKPARYWIEQLAGDDSDKAVEALSAIGAPAIPYVLDAIKIENPENWPEKLLDKMSGLPLIGQVADKLAEQRSRRAEIPDGAAEVLLSLRKHANIFVPELARIYQNPKRSEEVIERAAELLVDLGPEAASSMPSYLAHLRGTDRTRKPLTVSILSAIGPQARDAVPLLANLFNGDGSNDLSVAEALWNIDHDTNNSVKTCLRLLQARNPACSEELTTRAAYLLARVGPAARETIPALRNVFLKGSATTRFPVEQALRNIDALTLGALFDQANRMTRERIERIVASLGEQDIWAPTPARTNFFRALPAIAAFGGQARIARSRLVELLTTIPATVSAIDEHSYRTMIPLRTAQALGQIGDATGPVVSALASQLRNTNPIVAQACCEALGQLGPPAREAAPALRELLQAKVSPLRLAAAMALVKIAPDTATEVVPVLRELESFHDRRVRNAAQLARWKIEPAPAAVSTVVQTLGERETGNELVLPNDINRHEQEIERSRWSPLDDLLVDPDLQVGSLTQFTMGNISLLDKIRLLGWVGPEAKAALPQLVGILTTNSLALLRLRAADAIRRIDPATYEKLRLPGPLALPDNLAE